MAFEPYVTPAGIAAAIAASGAGLQLELTHVAIGPARFDSDGATALPDIREVATLSAAAAPAADQFLVAARFYSSGYTGDAYEVGSIGFYAGDPLNGGTLVAIHSTSTARYALRHSTAADYAATFNLRLAGVPPGSVTVVQDQTASLAISMMGDHVGAADPHPGYARRSDFDAAMAATLRALCDTNRLVLTNHYL